MSHVYLMGLATDYCVKFSVIDARQLGFTTRVVVDGCRPVNLNPGDERQALSELQSAGVEIVSSEGLNAHATG